MPTARGWVVVGAVVGLWVAGRVLGLVELMVVAGGGLLVLAMAEIATFTRTPRLEVHRTTSPAQAHVGDAARADLVVRNAGSVATPVCELADEFDGGPRAARLLLAPLRPSEAAVSAYRLPTASRGVHPVGPLTVVARDPFGLTRSRRVVGGVTTFVVHPRVHPLGAPPRARGVRVLGGDARPAPSPHGDEFRTLRDYELGDDLRRIHWRSVARLDHLVVREQDAPGEAPDTVVLDDRAGHWDHDRFERAVEWAASLVTALSGSGRETRFLTAATPDPPTTRRGEALERLALVQPSSGGRLVDVAGRLAPRGAQQALIAVVGDLDERELGLLAGLRRAFASVVVVRVGPGSSWSSSPIGDRVVVLDVGVDADPVEAWRSQTSRWLPQPAFRS